MKHAVKTGMSAYETCCENVITKTLTLDQRYGKKWLVKSKLCTGVVSAGEDPKMEGS